MNQICKNKFCDEARRCIAIMKEFSANINEVKERFAAMSKELERRNAIRRNERNRRKRNRQNRSKQ